MGMACTCVGVVIAVGCIQNVRKPDGTGQESRRGERPPCRNLHELIMRTRRGYVAGRSPLIIPIPREPNYIGTAALPVHTGPWDYLAEVPLLMYGASVRPLGPIATKATMADVAPTIAAIVDFGFDTDQGRVLSKPLMKVPPPRLVVTLVWDGAGMNVLREHRESWRYLRSLIKKGTSFTNMTIGSWPSNTPPLHTTLGTGVFPNRHGIPHVKMSTASGAYVDPFAAGDGSRIRVPTLADFYDRHEGNKPLVGLVGTVNWHLGMIGHGAAFPGGDGDAVVLLNAFGEQYGNTQVYSLPAVADPRLLSRATDELDQNDGHRDGKWKHIDLTDSAVRHDTPAYVHYQQQVLERVIDELGFGINATPDLLFVNFKQPDSAGHRWGMTSPQVGANVAAADRALKRLVDFLNARVGKDKWTIFLTADHGHTLYPHESGGWPIRAAELKSDLQSELESASSIERITSAGVTVDVDASLTDEDLDAIAESIASYTVSDNVEPGARVPEGWSDRTSEYLFDAVMVGRNLVESSCRVRGSR